MAEANEPILTIKEDGVDHQYNVAELSDEIKVLYNKLSELQAQHKKIAEASEDNLVLQQHYIDKIKPLLPEQEEANDSDNSESKKG